MVSIHHRQRRHVHQPPHRGGGRQDVHRHRRAEQDGADGDAVAAGDLEQVEGDVKPIKTTLLIVFNKIRILKYCSKNYKNNFHIYLYK